MTKIKRILFTLAASLGLLMPAAVPAIVSAQTPPAAPTAPTDTTQQVDIGGALCSGASFKLNPDCTPEAKAAGSSLATYIKTAINLFSIVVGIIAVVMIIIGGVKYITSGGDAGNVTGAKNTILYAIIGLVIVALSQVIVQFVLGSFA